MGIIIGDTISLVNGLSAQNTYGSFGDSQLIIEKVPELIDDGNNITSSSTPSYLLSCKGAIWTSQDYRNSLKTKIDAVNISMVITD